jgi:hypothetical protein
MSITLDRQKAFKAMEKMGSRFKLIALMQKRIREIVKSGEKQSGYDINKLHDGVLDEIMAGTLTLEMHEKKEKD